MVNDLSVGSFFLKGLYLRKALLAMPLNKKPMDDL